MPLVEGVVDFFLALFFCCFPMAEPATFGFVRVVKGAESIAVVGLAPYWVCLALFGENRRLDCQGETEHSEEEVHRGRTWLFLTTSSL